MDNAIGFEARTNRGSLAKFKVCARLKRGSPLQLAPRWAHGYNQKAHWESNAYFQTRQKVSIKPFSYEINFSRESARVTPMRLQVFFASV